MSTGQIKILITHQSSSNICVIPLIKSIEYDNYYYAKAEMQHLLSKAVPYHQHHILERKRNAYFDFQNDGFIMRTYFVLIPIMYTHLRRQFNSLTIFFFNFCWWRISFAMTSLPRTGMHRLYLTTTKAQKQVIVEENGSLNNFPF